MTRKGLRVFQHFRRSRGIDRAVFLFAYMLAITFTDLCFTALGAERVRQTAEMMRRCTSTWRGWIKPNAVCPKGTISSHAVGFFWPVTWSQFILFSIQLWRSTMMRTTVIECFLIHYSLSPSHRLEKQGPGVLTRFPGIWSYQASAELHMRRPSRLGSFSRRLSWIHELVQRRDPAGEQDAEKILLPPRLLPYIPRTQSSPRHKAAARQSPDWFGMQRGCTAFTVTSTALTRGVLPGLPTDLRLPHAST
ncbi:hypothetical protein B0H16DRAFT_1561035 [Mycena metata]|uniref:Uncharacterized protein n=1 Tax=Mycena metata TaxID=1033252 RepID=A0AAD7IKS3_9AGAR|nr:hypothetical protein B0H16DRAFT_1561035 [Mycena metata]